MMCPRCSCRLVVQPDGSPWCANCGDGELSTLPLPVYPESGSACSRDLGVVHGPFREFPERTL